MPTGSDYIGSLALVSKARYTRPLASHEQSKEDFGISDSEIFEEAVFSLLSEHFSVINYDPETFHCKRLASRIVNNQILLKLAMFPIVSSHISFPRLEELQNEALFLASDNYASSKYVKFLVAELQTEIPSYVDDIINKIIDRGSTSIFDLVLSTLNNISSFCRYILRNYAKQEKKTKELLMYDRSRS